MKISRSKCAGEEGSVFLVALGMTALFALVLGSYLTLVQGQTDSVSRSQNYNTAIPVAEAGVEEAMAMINKNYPSMLWTNNLTADGWSTLTSSNTTSKSNLVFGGSYYYVTVSNTSSGNPMITSVGVVPYIQHAWGAQVSTNRSFSSSTVALIRTVQVQTTASVSLFSAGIAAKGDISFGGNTLVDGFNSQDTNLSVNGQYSSTKVDDKVTVGTDGTLSQAILGNGTIDIRGYVNTGPGGTVVDHGSVSIGDNNWVSNGTTGIELSRSNDNFNVTFPDVTAPTATYIQSPSSGTVGGTNYDQVFQGNQYWGSSNVMYQTSLSGSIIVTGGAVTIYIPSGDTTKFTGSGSGIYVAPGASVTIYVGASSVDFGGNGFVGATNATNVAIYGLPSNTSITYDGNSTYVGTIYAPEADLTVKGGAVITGAMVGNTVTFQGGATLHYDESLGNTSPSSGYVASSWQEIATPLAYQSLPP